MNDAFKVKQLNGKCYSIFIFQYYDELGMYNTLNLGSNKKITEILTNIVRKKVFYKVFELIIQYLSKL